MCLPPIRTAQLLEWNLPGPERILYEEFMIYKKARPWVGTRDLAIRRWFIIRFNPTVDLLQLYHIVLMAMRTSWGAGSVPPKYGQHI